MATTRVILGESVLLIARKNLFSERTRLAISVGGVALSVFLISMLLSLYRGWDEKVGRFVEETNVDIWVGSTGVNDFLSAASIVPLQQSDLLNLQPEIENWAPIIVRPMTGVKVEFPEDPERDDEQGTKMDLQYVGFDLETRLAGPLRVIEGEDTPGLGEVIVDKALKKRYGINVGDTLAAGGRDWKVIGISEGGDFVGAQTVFVSLEEAQTALQLTDQATFIGIQLREGEDAEAFAESIEEQVPQATAFTRDEFVTNTRELVLGNVLPILFIVLILAFIVGLAVSGLTIYTATIEKSREYGIIKAVGFKNSYLYRLVFEQALVTGALGFLIGVGLTIVFGAFASSQVPQFVTLVRWQDLLLVFGVTIVMSLAAGYVPIRKLSGIDPVEAFKA
jgi:putative ABC transport system permease protein